MKYEFFCRDCNAIDEVDRPMSQAKDPYLCPDCGATTVRQYRAPQIITKGEQKPYYHPAFGQVMTDKQAQNEAKRRGWVEIGNEDVHKHTPAPKRVSYESPDYFV